MAAFDKNKMIAQLHFKHVIEDHPWYQHLGCFGMMVLKEYWGMGIGKHLLKLLDEYALRKNIVRIEAEVRTENDRGIRLYKNAGYEIEGTRRQASFINGQFQNEYYISKILQK